MSDNNLKSFEDLVEEEFPEAEVKQLAVVEGDYKELKPFDMQGIKNLYQEMLKFVGEQMHEGVDYGKIPGTGKRSLFKPGAEKLHTLFQFSVRTKLDDYREDWDVPVTLDTFPVFHYRYMTTVWRPNRTVASCDGSCNSLESKYRWRWVSELEVPQYLKDDMDKLEKREHSESAFAFAIEKGETTGKYGKPAEYWESWRQDIESGKATKTKIKAKSGKEFDGWERGGVQYRIPNDDIFSQVNTLVKMAVKRSYVGAIIIAANASNYFTQDLEDTIEGVEQVTPIELLVPNRKKAGSALISYAESLGVNDGGKFIKELLETNNIDFSLDKWTEIIELVNKHAAQ